MLCADVTRPLRTPFMRAFSDFMNGRVFKITRSNNTLGEQAGLLNGLTPLVYRLKYFFIGLKQINRRVYSGVKHPLVALTLYMLLFHGIFEG